MLYLRQPALRKAEVAKCFEEAMAEWLTRVRGSREPEFKSYRMQPTILSHRRVAADYPLAIRTSANSHLSDFDQEEYWGGEQHGPSKSYVMAAT